MCVHLDGERLLFALQELWPIGLWSRDWARDRESQSLFLFPFPPAWPPPSFIKAIHHAKWHQPQRVSDKTFAWSLRTELAAVHVLSPLPLSAFCFPSVHPISQMKLNRVCSVSNFLFLSLFSLSLAALLPCLSSALQLLDQQCFLGLPLSFTVSGLLHELQINNCK